MKQWDVVPYSQKYANLSLDLGLIRQSAKLTPWKHRPQTNFFKRQDLQIWHFIQPLMGRVDHLKLKKQTLNPKKRHLFYKNLYLRTRSTAEKRGGVGVRFHQQRPPTRHGFSMKSNCGVEDTINVYPFSHKLMM